MIRLKPVIRTLAALICLGAAFLLLARSGLPDRIELNERASADRSGAALEIGSPAPPFQLTNLSGQDVALDSAAGTVTIINFWATFCAPCRQEMRDLQQLTLSRAESLRVLAINMGEPASLVAAWGAEHSISYDLLLDPTLAVPKQYMVRGIPTTYLLDSSQRIRKVYYGPVTGRQLEHDMERLAQRA